MEIRFMADRNFKSRPPAWRPPPQHLEAAAAYIIGSICQMMAMVGTTPSSIWDQESRRLSLLLLQDPAQKATAFFISRQTILIEILQPSLLFLQNNFEPFIITRVKLANQAWNS